MGAMFGALVIGVISSGLIQFGITASWGIFATGSIIIAAVVIDRLVRARQVSGA
jgi:ribose transport system permease protein